MRRPPDSAGRAPRVVSAHAADLVRRGAGAIAATTSAGGRALVVARSYGERRQSGEFWKSPGRIGERVTAIRHDEATPAAAEFGARVLCLDLGDSPIVMINDASERLVALIIETGTDMILTRAERDPSSPDDPVAYAMTERARQLASGAGAASGFPTARGPEFLCSNRINRNCAGPCRGRFWTSRRCSPASCARRQRWRRRCSCADTTPSARPTALIAPGGSAAGGRSYAEALRRVSLGVVRAL